MATAKNVTVIPATFNPQTRRPLKQVTRRRVAGYARVSTDSDEQFTSYEAQVDYYTNYINSNPEWSSSRCIRTKASPVRTPSTAMVSRR